MERKQLCLGKLYQKYLQMIVFSYAFFFEDSEEWLHKLSNKARSYLQANIHILPNVLNTKIVEEELKYSIEYNY